MAENFGEGEASPVFQNLNWAGLPSHGLDPQKSERPSVTPEIKKILDLKLASLGDLFSDAHFWWQVDGALNISLAKGEYIGNHGDVDISVLRQDVPALESLLSEKGYGLFLKKEGEKGNNIYKRVAGKNFQREEAWGLRIMKVDRLGVIDREADLISIDVAVIDMNEDGEPISSVSKDCVLPKEWLEGKTMDFQGIRLNLSHPARFIFNKIRFNRAYDEGDIDAFLTLKLLSKKDVEGLERIITPLVNSAESARQITPTYANFIRARLEKIKASV